MNYETQTKMNTFDDLLRSGMKPKMEISLKEGYSNLTYGSLESIIQNSEGFMFSKRLACIEQLVNFRNNCFYASTSVEYTLVKYKDASGELIVKIIPESAQDEWFYIYFESGSLYTFL